MKFSKEFIFEDVIKYEKNSKPLFLSDNIQIVLNFSKNVSKIKYFKM